MTKQLVALRIDDELKSKAEEIAAIEQRTVSSVYIDAMAQYLGLPDFEPKDYRAKGLRKPRSRKKAIAK